MKIQKLNARIAAGICTDADIESYLIAEALKPVVAAEQRYLELQATPDRESQPEVTATRTITVSDAVYEGPDANGEYALVTPAVTEPEIYIVSDAIDYNALRDAEITQLEADYPHLIEPEQTYHEETKFDEEGNETTVSIPDAMPTVEQRRPELVLDQELAIPFIIKKYETLIQNMHDAEAKRRGYDNINSVGKYIGYDNAFRDECEALGVWVAACWAKCYDLLNSGEFVTEEELLGQLPSV